MLKTSGIKQTNGLIHHKPLDNEDFSFRMKSAWFFFEDSGPTAGRWYEACILPTPTERTMVVGIG
jgi:hypothetical protein